MREVFRPLTALYASARIVAAIAAGGSAVVAWSSKRNGGVLHSAPQMNVHT